VHDLGFPCLMIVNLSMPSYCISSRSKTVARKSFECYKHSTFEDRDESQAARMLNRRLSDEGRAASEEIRSCLAAEECQIQGSHGSVSGSLCLFTTERRALTAYTFGYRSMRS